VTKTPPPRPDLITAEEVEQATLLLERIVAHRGALAGLGNDARERLMMAAGRASRPNKDQQRKLHREFRRLKRDSKRAKDEARLEATGIREKRRDLVYLTPDAESVVATPESVDPSSWPLLEESRNCYVCKQNFDRLHTFYDQMCPPCAVLNYQKRGQTADLSGRVALLTGGRVKIGFQIGVMLLRAGAHLIVTTRFPRDAARRYAAEKDFADWEGRLSVHGLDLRHTPSVEAFAEHLIRTEDRLDFVVHNACQTVRRPSAWYGHLMDGERQAPSELPAAQREVLASYEALVVAKDSLTRETVGWTNAPALSQLALLEEDLEGGEELFPLGALDQDQQQIDLRAKNSWRYRLHEVPTVELLEVLLVNATAPFVLNARLKPLMERVTSQDKHIVNVSAVEGQFYRTQKTDKHPHTNMAKAALNMMTRTAAPDYRKSGIHMNSVDTGWVTDEDPVQIAERKRDIHRFHPPLDIVDGAARVLDPIFHGIGSGEHIWGQFLKDYAPTKW
jgi:NAD(P)-dependent dehydrogenase (short-subunit alcohol dehydrogenase family)